MNAKIATPRGDEYRQVNVRFTAEEIAAIRNITKVDAIAPAVVAIVRQRIDDEKNNSTKPKGDLP